MYQIWRVKQIALTGHTSTNLEATAVQILCRCKVAAEIMATIPVWLYLLQCGMFKPSSYDCEYNSLDAPAPVAAGRWTARFPADPSAASAPSCSRRSHCAADARSVYCSLLDSDDAEPILPVFPASAVCSVAIVAFAVCWAPLEYQHLGWSNERSVQEVNQIKIQLKQYKIRNWADNFKSDR